ncbi:beta strand repeat-containing protein [Aurantiacibacter marinus]|uniref:beta strand repeat-containing protein n=3 Tax=Aurantiacibacter marinus TaxID=874156 RepID=UPI000B1BFB61|nr:VCBS domain-containing protein [Aurantiacibacter marinus]
MSEELNGFDGEMGDSDIARGTTGPSASPATAKSANQATQVIPAGAGNVVTLPDGQSIDSLDFDGRDLVIILSDGTRIVVPDGAIIIPQIIVDGTPIPPANIAALLEGATDPTAGVNPSSGGNFATDPGAIQSAFDLGDLLPYTELPQGVLLEEEIIPGLIEDEEPEILIVTDDNPAGASDATTSVDEAGLPERGDEPEGTEEPANSETTSGTIVFVATDGLGSITLNGVEISAVGQTVAGDFGTLTITSINLDTGEIGFDYRLDDNSVGNGFDDFEAVVTDADGDVAVATLRVNIIDDAPVGIDDLGTVPQGSHEPLLGNVLDNDIPGADDFPAGGGVTGFSNTGGSAAPGASLQGTYGVLTINEDGTYSYVRDVNTPGGVQETFNYAIVDQDGSTSSAVLTIAIANGPAVITFVPETGEGTIVNEAGLPERDDEPAGTGEIADDDPQNDSDPSETTSATVTFNSVDGLGSITINGVIVDQGNLPQTIVSDDIGTLVITAVTYDPVTGDGSITYEYTLADNTSGNDTSVTFVISVTDLDGDTASDDLTITIVDDSPSAEDDAAGLGPGEYGPVGGTVLANDTQGADGAAVTDYSGTGGSGSAGDVVQGTYGTLTIAADGTFSYTRDPGTPGGVTDTFNYVITDGDGNVADADLVISIANSITSLDLPVKGGDGALVDEAGVESPFPGSAAAGDSEITSGTFTYTAPDGPAVVTIDGIAVTGAGQTFTGSFGTLTIDSVAIGSIGYTYELNTNTTGDETFDSFAVLVSDQDGDTSSGALQIAIIDDVPMANPDLDSVTEDGPLLATGNVLTGVDVALGDANSTDGVADVQGADSAAVTGVAAGQTTDDVAGNVGGGVAGAYGTITILANGDYEYALDNQNPAVQGLDKTETLTDVFTYTITDGDGDTDTTVVTVTINGADDPVVLSGFNLQGAEEVVDEDDLPDGSSPDAAALTQAGTFDVTSADGLETLSVGGTSIFGSGVTYPVTITGTYGTLTVTGVATTLDIDGDVVAATVSYQYTLSDNTDAHLLSGEDILTDSFAVVATDTDGSSDNDVLDIDIVDDVPFATANENTVGEGADVSGNVLSDDDGFGTDVSGADGYGSVGAVIGIASVNQGTLDTSADGLSNYVLSGEYGTLTLNVDGSYTYAANADITDGAVLEDVFEYTIEDEDGDRSTATLTIDVTNVTVTAADDEVLVDEDGLAGPPAGSNAGTDSEIFDGSITPSGGTGPYTFELIGANADGDGDYGTLVLNADGSYTYTLDTAFTTSPDTNNGENAESPAGESFGYRVTDADGNTFEGTIAVTIVDDVPFAFAPDAAFIFNKSGAVAAGPLHLDIDDNIFDNFGADGPGSVSFANITSGVTTLSSSGGTPLTSSGDPIVLVLTNGGQTLEARAGTSTGDVVFTVALQQGASTYTVQMGTAPLDNGSGFSFSNLSGGTAGNPPFKLIDSATSGSTELAVTPRGTATTVNSDSDDIAAGSQFIGFPDGIRFDFGDFTYFPNGGGSSDDTFSTTSLEVINGFKFTIDQISNGTTAGVKIVALLDPNPTVPETDSGSADPAGDDVAQQITSVEIYDSLGNLVAEVSASATNVGTSNVDVTFGATAADGVTINDLPASWSILTNTVNGYTAIEIDNVRGSASGTDGKFSLSQLTIEISQQGTDLFADFDLQIVDGDGDVVIVTDAINIEFDADGIVEVPPIVLDLDGGGNMFIPLSSGIAYDYNGDGVKTQTAWVAAGSAILAFDYNSDGLVSDASEFAFGGNGLTDLQAVAARFDANSDGVLDANDPAYSGFGVWLDSNLDAIADEGEFVSLSDAGITSISLISDALGYVDADGDVTISGSASFTMADGSTGAVSDAAFATGADIADGMGMMEALLILGEGEGSSPAGNPAFAISDIAQDAVSDALAGKAIDSLIEQFTGGPDDMRVEFAEGHAAQLFDLLSININGQAMSMSLNVNEIAMDDSSDLAVLHG